jgi:hypothetical protein
LRAVQFKNCDQGIGNREDGFAGLALGCLDLAVPGRTSDVEQPSLKVNILPLKSKRFARAKAIHYQNAVEGSPRFFGDGEDSLELVDREVRSFVPRTARRHPQLGHVDLGAVIAPVAGRG